MTVVIRGMLGLGDNLHQRAVVRQMMARDREVWLESPWVAPYHDLIDRGLKVVRRQTALRTQSKNAERELHRFHAGPVPAESTHARVWYTADMVRSAGSIVGAMCQAARVDPRHADFRLPVPHGWFVGVSDVLDARARDGRPLLVYRPLTVRNEWPAAARNPDPAAYATLFAAIRERFFVVSVADIAEAHEWIISEPVRADVTCHHGELVFEALAALFTSAAVVFSASGFAPVLALAVGAPVITVFGGVESSAAYDTRHGRFCGIDTIAPCLCLSSRCPGPGINPRLARFRTRYRRPLKVCDKVIDVPRAMQTIAEFLDADGVAARTTLDPASARRSAVGARPRPDDAGRGMPRAQPAGTRAVRLA